MQDWYARDYYKESPRDNPSGPESGSYRVVRGGSWNDNLGDCRSASRYDAPPDDRNRHLGFRLARTGAWPFNTFTLAQQQAEETPVQPPCAREGPEPRYQPYQGFQDRLQDGTAAPEMVYLLGGTFKMGDSQGKSYQTEAEREGGAYVFDDKGWGQKSDANWRNPYFSQDDRHPVVCISWNDAMAYCEWLSEQTRESYSLLTEAEWEYACRASSEAAYCFGDDERLLGDYAWYSKNSKGRTYPVGKQQRNRWGLHDMHGNVWEWVRDWFGNYSSEPQSNPDGLESGSHRVVRGGSWNDDPAYCRSAYRDDAHPADRDGDLGFRLVKRV